MKITYRAKLLAVVLALGLGISLSVPGVALATTNQVWNADSTVTLGSNDYTIVSGSEAASFAVGTSTITVNVDAGDVFTFRSSSRFPMNNNQGVTQFCGPSYSELQINGNTETDDVIITPDTTSSCSNGGSGGGGGGGGGAPAPTPTPTPTPSVTPTPTPTPVPSGVAHPAGSVEKTADGTVWFITRDGGRRAFTSGGAFLSYGFLSFSQVGDMNSGDNALPAGSFIPPRDGSIFCATVTKGTDVKGECALITGGQKSAFTSEAVFKALGFSFANAQYGDSSFLAKTSNTSSGSAQHRPGVLVNNAGTVQLVGTNSLLGIPSMDVLTGWGYSLSSVVPANAADKLLPQSGVMPTRLQGELNPTL